MKKEIKVLKNKQIISIVLVIILILNLALFAFSIYGLIMFWGVIITVFLITFLFFKKRIGQ